MKTWRQMRAGNVTKETQGWRWGGRHRNVRRRGDKTRCRPRRGWKHQVTNRMKERGQRSEARGNWAGLGSVLNMIETEGGRFVL